MGNVKVVYREKNAEAMQSLMDTYSAMLDSVLARGRKHYAGLDVSIADYKDAFAAAETAPSVITFW